MFAGLFFFLVLAVIFDLKTYRIPNALTMAGMAAGLIYNLYRAGPPGLPAGATDLLISTAILYPLYMIQCLGAGDIKLLSVISIFLGWKQGLVISIYSLAAGAVLGILKGSILFAVRRSKSRIQKVKEKSNRREVNNLSLSDSEKKDVIKKESAKKINKKEVAYLFAKKTTEYKKHDQNFNRKQTSNIVQIRKRDDQKCTIHYSIAVLAAFLISRIK